MTEIIILKDADNQTTQLERQIKMYRRRKFNLSLGLAENGTRDFSANQHAYFA